MALTIRKAAPGDSDKIAEAIFYAGGEFLPWLFGKKYKDIIAESVMHEQCSFSWVNSIVCEIDGNIAGVVVCYPSEKEKEMDKGMSDILRKYFSFWTFFTFIRRARKAIKYFQKPESSYYILAIAVFPEFRGQGVAGKLMSHVEETARHGNYSAISLEVESYNFSALRTYQKFGFVKHTEVPLWKFSRHLRKDKDSSMLLLRKYLG